MGIPILSRFFKKKSAEELLLIDMGTHTIRTSVVSLPAELQETPRMLGENSLEIGRAMMRGRYINDLDELLEVTWQTIDHATLSAGKQPSEVILGLSAGAIRYSGLTIRIKRPEPESPVTTSELDSILARIEKETKITAREKIGLDETWEHLGAVITDYRIGDKYVASPVDLAGDQLECLVLHGYWEKETHDSVDMISSQLGLDVSVVWETAVAKALRIRDERESFLLVDIGGRATEIVLVTGRRVVSNVVINVGSDDWTDRLARDFQINGGQAEKLKHSYQEGVLDQKRSSETREILEDEVGKYVKMLALGIESLPSTTDLPATMYFAGSGANLNIVKSKVLTYPWTKDGLFTNFPHIERLTDSFTNESLFYAYTVLS